MAAPAFVECMLDYSESKNLAVRRGTDDANNEDTRCVMPQSVGNGGEVSILVGGETFVAHRAVLAARSPFFKAQLFSKADANKTGGTIVITLRGVEPETFLAVLPFMYADALPGDEELTTESLQRLLAAADAFRMDGLKLACAEKLWERVSPETVAETMCCAEAHSCPELKGRCIDFFLAEENMAVAALSEGFRQLVLCFPSLVDELRARAGFGMQNAEEDFTLDAL